MMHIRNCITYIIHIRNHINHIKHYFFVLGAILIVIGIILGVFLLILVAILLVFVLEGYNYNSRISLNCTALLRRECSPLLVKILKIHVAFDNTRSPC